jgi:hypothetical protein
LAEHRFVGAALIAGHGLVCQPMLHVHTGPGTFEDEVAHVKTKLLMQLVSLTAAPISVLIPVNAGRQGMQQIGFGAAAIGTRPLPGSYGVGSSVVFLSSRSIRS